MNVLLRRRVAVSVGLLVLVAAAGAQQEAPQRAESKEYLRTDEMIPMRDGVKLHVAILRPVGSESGGEPLPFLMERTPYGTDNASPKNVAISKPELAASGYIFVFGDIRGRYQSEGTFVMNRPIVAHTTKNDVDETTDAQDTIDWLLKNVPNNSERMGVLGVSYPGFLAISAGIDAHPAVKAISLCRCGMSSKRPFCDGTHGREGWKCEASPIPTEPVALG